MRLRPTALLVGLLLASPALWRALVEGTMPAGTALQRTLVALLVASVGAAVFEAVVRPYVGSSARLRRSAADEDGPRRRLADLPAPRAAGATNQGMTRASMGSRPATVGDDTLPAGGIGLGGPTEGAQ